MRKIIIGILLSVLVFSAALPAAASNGEDYTTTAYTAVNELADVTLEVKAGSLSETGLTVVVHNESDIDLTFGSFYCLEQWLDDGWYHVPYLSQEYDIGWTSEGYDVPAGQAYEYGPTNWGWLYGSLESGKYRIIKDGIGGNGGNITKYWFAVDFTLPASESGAREVITTSGTDNANPETGAAGSGLASIVAAIMATILIK